MERKLVTEAAMASRKEDDASCEWDEASCEWDEIPSFEAALSIPFMTISRLRILSLEGSMGLLVKL
jgi:hypothetical protein